MEEDQELITGMWVQLVCHTVAAQTLAHVEVVQTYVRSNIQMSKFVGLIIKRNQIFFTLSGQRGVSAGEGLRVQVPLRRAPQAGAGLPQVRLAADPQAARQVCTGE